MNTLEKNNWQPFQLGGEKGIFIISKGNRLTKSNMQLGDKPFIGASAKNNGITAWVGNEIGEVSGGKISVAYNGSVGSSFWQPRNFLASDDVNYCAPNVVAFPNFILSENVALFLCTIIRKIGENFSYEDKWTKEDMEKATIYLPADTNGIPDWKKMSDYIATLRTRCRALLPAMRAVPTSPTLQTTEWKAFPIVELFNIILACGDNQEKNLPEGDVPLVSAGKTANGIVKLIEYGAEGTEIYPGGSLTVDMFGYAFYQPQPFYAVSHGRVMILTPKEPDILSPAVALFLATVLTRTFAPKSSYDSLCTKKILEDSSIILPVDKHGTPNWNYMQEYMEQIGKKQAQKLEAMQAATVA